MAFSRNHLPFWALVLAAAVLAGCGGSESSNGKTDTTGGKADLSEEKAAANAAPVNGDPKRKAAWAKPLEKPGLANLHEVAPGLYRGAQPEVEGFRSLKAMGVKTVVNLRNFHSDKDELKASEVEGIALVELPMNAHSVKEEDIISFLKIATDEAKLPLFFHCKHGSDRTGTMAAAYRMVVQGWSKDDAVEELKEGGYGFHSIWANLPKLLKKLDVEKVKGEL